MRALNDLVTDFMDNERPDGVVLDPEQVSALALAATRFHAGYAAIRSLLPQDPTEPVNVSPAITEEVVLSWSEWALIKRLFLLYVEQENARHLEATRIMGGDVFGRTSSELAMEIQQLEAEYPRFAFYSEPLTIE